MRNIRFEVACDVRAPRPVVWAVLTDWERQPEWMLDAKAVEVRSLNREGTGVTIRCPTNLLGVTVQDIMRVTRWDPPRELAVTHLGRVITGSGAFVLERRGDGTHIRWWEQVTPPLGTVGEWGARALLQPVLRRLFGASLRRFATLAEAAAGD